jgi:hypothetical protein
LYALNIPTMGQSYSAFNSTFCAWYVVLQDTFHSILDYTTLYVSAALGVFNALFCSTFLAVNTTNFRIHVLFKLCSQASVCGVALTKSFSFRVRSY